MTRQIKFRVWKVKEKKMECDNDLVVPIGVDLAPFNILFNIEDWIYMQFTGFYDKDNKEIYEGDILQFSNEHLTRTSRIFWNKRDGRWSQKTFIMFKSDSRAKHKKKGQS